MSPIQDLFLHEYFGRPENRVNVALFALMQQDWFREWFLGKLGLQDNAIVYPPKNRGDVRPDLKVVDPGHNTLAWIEVELGTDLGQLKRYRRKLYPEPVMALWGTPGENVDLSLEEVAEHLECQTGLSPQVAANAQQLAELIREGLRDHVPSPGRSSLSPQMREHPLVAGLSELLGERLRFDLGANEPPAPGDLKADTTATHNNLGFSLRVYSPEAQSGSLSIMSVSAGRRRIMLPSLEKLEEYLPVCRKQVEWYRSAVLRIGGPDIGTFRKSKMPPLALDMAVERLDELAPCLLALARCYGGCGCASLIPK